MTRSTSQRLGLLALMVATAAAAGAVYAIIQGRNTGHALLASKPLLDRTLMPAGIVAISIGRHLLRGKPERLELFALEGDTQGRAADNDPVASPKVTSGAAKAMHCSGGAGGHAETPTPGRCRLDGASSVLGLADGDARYRAGRESDVFKRGLLAITVAVVTSVASSIIASAQTRTGYAPVNGLEMYYEIHGAGRPVVLLHGALMTIEGFEELLPSLAETRQVIAVEQQAHGRTADIERPFGYEQMADDTAALLGELEIEQADFFGYSMGGAIALQVVIRHPDLVRKLVIAASAFSPDGLYPEVLDNIRNLKPADFAGSPWLEAYARVAPDPESWPTLLAKVRQLVGRFEGWPPETIRSVEAPALVIVADSDVVRPEHAFELFRLLGGGAAGDLTRLPPSQLAVLPGTTHVSLVERADWLTPMVTDFLDARCRTPSDRPAD